MSEFAPKNQQATLKSIQKFCKTVDLNIFYSLPTSVQQMFLTVSDFILYRLVGSCPQGQATQKRSRCLRRRQRKRLLEGFEKSKWLKDINTGKLLAERWKEIKSQDQKVPQDDLVKSMLVELLLAKGVWLGLAQVIHNALTVIQVPIYKELYSINQVNMMVSDSTVFGTQGMKILLIGDSHQIEHGCGQLDAKRVTDFIKTQVMSATGFVDLFLEIPWVAKNKLAKSVGGSMGWMYDMVRPCFQTGEARKKTLTGKSLSWWEGTECPYFNLRAHYVDLRDMVVTKNKGAFGGIKDPHNNYNIYNTVFRGIISLYYSNYSNYVLTSEDTVLINKAREILKTKRAKEVFKNVDSVDETLADAIRVSKIGKQISMIKNARIVKVLNKWKKLWSSAKDNPNLKHGVWADYAGVFNIEFLTKIFDEKEVEKLHGEDVDPFNFAKFSTHDVEKAYNIFARFPSVLMDLYTLARLFRGYRPIKGKYSHPTKNAIIFAGGFHTMNYEEVLKELGFYYTYQKNSYIKDDKIKFDDLRVGKSYNVTLINWRRGDYGGPHTVYDKSSNDVWIMPVKLNAHGKFIQRTKDSKAREITRKKAKNMFSYIDYPFCVNVEKLPQPIFRSEKAPTVKIPE